MGLTIKKVYLIIILILLQSCSGGRVGNFLESSFKNVEEPRVKEENKNSLKIKEVIKAEEKEKNNKNIKQPKIKEETENSLKIKEVIKAEEKEKNNKNIKEPIIKEETENSLNIKKVINARDKAKNNKRITKQKNLLFKKQYQPQSYKIIFILKDVDPKDPIENLSTILRNSDVNFEIEKIERFFDSKNKSININ
ncbi:hypothetical protein OA503_01100 [Prochlorococcus sp. AH-716-K03]|nr:hypothetical protein [Prochlorococcus sp. AH-716-K03]